jgi:hypothetical protein
MSSQVNFCGSGTLVAPSRASRDVLPRHDASRMVHRSSHKSHTNMYLPRPHDLSAFHGAGNAGYTTW